MAERLKAHDWNSCGGVILSGVRIPLSPLNRVLTKEHGFLMRIKKASPRSMLLTMVVENETPYFSIPSIGAVPFCVYLHWVLIGSLRTSDS